MIYTVLHQPKWIGLIASMMMLISCNSEPKKVPEKFQGYQLQTILFLEKQLYLPSSFQPSTLEAIAETIQNDPDPDGFTEYELERLDNFRRMGSSVVVFTEGDNYKNSISFQPGEYIELDESVVNIYTEMLEYNLFAKQEAYGIKRERLEARFIKKGVSNIVKVKYLQSYEQEQMYMTQYLVQYKGRTFGIIVTHLEDQDYELILDNFTS